MFYKDVYMRQYFYKFPNGVVYLSILLLCVVVITLYKLSNFPSITLVNDQIYYHLTTLIQIIVTIFSVTIAGCIYYSGLLDNQALSDESLESLNHEIRTDLMYSLIFISITTIISVLFCFSSLIFTTIDFKYYDILINASGVVSFSQIFTNIFFVLTLFDPKKVINLADRILSEKNKSDKSDTGNDKIVSLGDFLDKFNELELVLSKIVEDKNLSEDIQNRRKNTGIIPIFQSSKILSRHNLLGNDYGRILEIINYRNALVHGTQFINNEVNYKVNCSVYNSLVDLLPKVKNV